MAAVTTSVIGAGLSAYQIAQAAKAKKEASAALNDYDRQELDNAFAEIPLSTVGSDILSDNNASNAAGVVNALQNAGSRAVIGGAPRVQAVTNNINQDIRRYFDEQDQRRNYAIAGDNARIEGITENRDIANIGALGSQITAANQDMWNGALGIASSIGYAGRNITPGVNEPVTATTNTPMPLATQPAATMTPTANTLPYYPPATGPVPMASPSGQGIFDFASSYNPEPTYNVSPYSYPYFNFQNGY